MIVLRMVYLRDAAFCGYSSSGYRFASPAWADRVNAFDWHRKALDQMLEELCG